MCENYLISVIITNYNYEMYIDKAIQSVKNQTYENWELIIVDDGSTDGSQKIIEENIQDIKNKVKVIYKENGGQASGFNTGFENAIGDIIAFLDADDYWYPNKLEVIRNYHITYDSVQHNLLVNNQYKFTFLEEGRLKQRKLTENYGFMGIIPTSAMSFKKFVLDNVFPVPEGDYKICADIYIRIFSYIFADMISIDEPLGCYRVHGENGWYSNPSIAFSYNATTLKRMNEYREENGQSSISKINESETFAQVFIESIYTTLNKNKKYIIYGNGELGKVVYDILTNGGYKISGFSNSNFEGEPKDFYKTKLMSIEYLKNNPHEYDQIIIGSAQLVEIFHFLLENTFSKEKIIVPKF
ncbi:glycosyltransferase [Metasolibacillus meyeri]|uniref:glycosyltransferase n=1 Tax=Metasolibacillus meyeri TaxID=1071052 RepID=UPI000D30F8A3|nr:glycosyltransferase [Metasolibacillus meyeri]